MVKHLTLIIFFTLTTACTTICVSNDDAVNHLRVDEQALNKGILKISLPEKHPKNLAIKTPANEWYYLQDPTIPVQTIPQKTFESVSYLELDAINLEGVTWRDGKKIKERVFKENGKYLIYFADNLETEPDNTFSMGISVNFKNVKSITNN